MDRIPFKIDNVTLVYDASIISVTQSELARELAEFKIHQQEALPDKFDQVLRSGGAEYLSLLMAFILREVNPDGTIRDFDRIRAETIIQPLIAKMPATEITRFQEVIKDFFSITGNSNLSSQLLQGRKKQNAQEALFRTMVQMMLSGKQNKEELQNSNIKNPDALNQEN